MSAINDLYGNFLLPFLSKLLFALKPFGRLMEIRQHFVSHLYECTCNTFSFEKTTIERHTAKIAHALYSMNGAKHLQHLGDLSSDRVFYLVFTSAYAYKYIIDDG